MPPPLLPAPPTPRRPLAERLRQAVAVFRETPATFRLVWAADRGGAIVLALFTLVAALLPAGLAWVGKLIIDTLVLASQTHDPALRRRVFYLVAIEAALAAAQLVLRRLVGLRRELLRAHLGNLLSQRILEKALTLELRHFEDAEVYDKMQNARREAASRPLSLVMGAFDIVQQAITLVAYSALLFRLSPASVVVIFLASIPAFIAEARLAGESFRLHSFRAPEGRKLNYLEWILTRDSHVKEVKLFDLGPLILGRYRTLFDKFYGEDRRLAFRRLVWGVGLGLVAVLAFYACYAATARRAAGGEITVGDVALYLTVFRQGQQAFQSILSAIGGMYEDALFMSNLFVYFDIPTSGERSRREPPLTLPRGGGHAIELRDVSFRYPGRAEWALRHVNLILQPGEKLGLVGENGAGKSTLVKLLLRLYEPTEGEILYGGIDLRDLDPRDLRERIGAVYQDFVRYQFSAGENIGLGYVPHLDDRARIVAAADKGGARGIVESLPAQYDTALGGWFERGHELSAGQWQKLAVARAFMRLPDPGPGSPPPAEILILDEPTAAIDAGAEHELFQRFRALAADRTAIIISHRFSTVRMADRIAVLVNGEVAELGSHRELIERNGRYAHLFSLQAQGYLD